MVEMACTTDILDFDRGAIETVPIRSYKGGWIVLNFVMHMYFEVHIDLIKGKTLYYSNYRGYFQKDKKKKIIIIISK